MKRIEMSKDPLTTADLERIHNAYEHIPSCVVKKTENGYDEIVTYDDGYVDVTHVEKRFGKVTFTRHGLTYTCYVYYTYTWYARDGVIYYRYEKVDDINHPDVVTYPEEYITYEA